MHAGLFLPATTPPNPDLLRFPESSSHQRNLQSLLVAPQAHNQASSPGTLVSKYSFLIAKVPSPPQKPPCCLHSLTTAYSTPELHHQPRCKDDGDQNYWVSDRRLLQ